MIEQRSQELVVGCLAASAVVAAGSQLATGSVPGLRLIVGYTFTGAALATASMFAPDLAGAMAALILTSTVFLYGRPLMDTVTSLTASGPTSPTLAPTTTRAPNPMRST